MEILLLTAIYPEPHRNDLKKDTEAIRYFVKEWTKSGHSVKVIHNYLHPIKSIFRFDSKRFSSIVETSIIDDAEVLLLEHQLLWPQAGKLIRLLQKRAEKSLKNHFSKNTPDYKPDVIIAHFPLYQRGIINRLPFDAPKIAVLHQTDVRIMESIKDKDQLNEFFDNFQAVGFRAKYIEDSFNHHVDYQGEQFLVYSGIPSNYIMKDVTEKKFNKKELNILYAGKLIKRKNVDTIIQSLNDLSEVIPFFCNIIGEGPEKENISKVIIQYKMRDKIKIHSKMSREKVVDYMKDADIFIMVSHNETFGLVYLEAMSQGCIVIGSKGEGIDGVIEDGVNGFLIKPKDVDALSKKISEIFNLTMEEKVEISMNAIKTSHNMTDQIMARKYIEFLKNIT